MGHDARLPTLATLEEVMHRDPFELIDTPWGKLEAWRASTIACGTMGALAQVAAIVRSDAAELQEKTAALDAKKSAVLSTVNRLLRFMSRVDALTARVEALETKRKADEAQQRESEEEPLALPPDIAEYQTLSPPRKVGDETPAPSGELHSIAAKEEEPSSELPEPPLEVEDAGGVPLSYGNVPTSYVRGRDHERGQRDATGDLPEEVEQPTDPVPEPKGRVYPQPVAISLNEE
jgi:hypothetical protein